ncbi:hypothetical protein Vadar_028273 [Vaccinium darrowii]|uniref:Uncharacterized protein n=1 Tax=Vaccinium darrowii TaxID=229202 RepID=A0ACB7XKE0_9ERIC|nr:hypothetical protein Vadar_028273 [Vaccinium darrowii]
MQGDFRSNRIREHTSTDAYIEIHEIAEEFDWDMEDHAGWSEVDLRLLQTPYGSRIPRKKDWWSRRTLDCDESRSFSLWSRFFERKKKKL